MRSSRGSRSSSRPGPPGLIQNSETSPSRAPSTLGSCRRGPFHPHHPGAPHHLGQRQYRRLRSAQRRPAGQLSRHDHRRWRVSAPRRRAHAGWKLHRQRRGFLCRKNKMGICYCFFDHDLNVRLQKRIVATWK